MLGRLVPGAVRRAKVVIADIRPEAVAAALEKLRDEGITAHGITLDITDRAAYAALRSKVAAARTSALFDLPRYTAHLETAIEMMWTSAVTGTTGNLTVPKGN